jgi:electron transfer flavoprotein alpha subunit
MDEGRLAAGTGELIALARAIGDKVGVALVGDALDAAANAVALGADRVYLLGGDALVTGGQDAYLQAYERVCEETEPSAVLVSKSDAGSDIGPRLATRIGAALAQDCTAVGLAPGGDLTATRPVYGGNAVARVSFGPERPAVAIVRGKAYGPLEPDPSRTGEIVELQPKIDPARVRVRSIRKVEAAATGVRLEDASVVVSGGRGLGGPEPFEQLTELAALLGGAVGASRAACDAGWIDHAAQVGLTGRTITPDLYLTVGISGASQHMAGCLGAKNIVAINSDESANIFKESRYGVVGDWKAVLPAFLAAVRELGDV